MYDNGSTNFDDGGHLEPTGSRSQTIQKWYTYNYVWVGKWPPINFDTDPDFGEIVFVVSHADYPCFDTDVDYGTITAPKCNV